MTVVRNFKLPSRELTIWVVFGLLMIAGTWVGIALPLVAGVVDSLPLALLAFGAAIALLIANAVLRAHGFRAEE